MKKRFHNIKLYYSFAVIVPLCISTCAISTFCSSCNSTTKEEDIKINFFSDGNGTISPSSIKVKKNTKFNNAISTLKISSTQGYSFDKWIDINGKTVDESYVITKNISVTALFRISEHNIKLCVEGNGTILTTSIQHIKKGTILKDIDDQIKPTPYPKSTFDGYYVDGKKVDPQSFIIDSDITIVVKFNDPQPSPSDLFTFSNYDETKHTVQIEQYNGSETINDVVIPSTVNIKNVNFTVVSIADNAFFDCKNLKSILLPKTISSIGTKTFAQCSNLNFINIPDGISSIPSNAFAKCSSLPSIFIPNTVTLIGEQAFDSCSLLATVNIPDDIIIIKRNAFSGCKSIKSIIIPDGLIYMEDCAFNECTNLTSIQLPESLVSIGKQAFSSTGLVSITIPSHIKLIDDSTFQDCRNLKTVTLPDILTKIGEKSFSFCSSLTTINFPNSLEEIKTEAFLKCTSLTSVLFHESLEKIGNRAFADCEKITDTSGEKGKCGFSYSGVVEQWKRCERENDWHINTHAKKIACSDAECDLDFNY